MLFRRRRRAVQAHHVTTLLDNLEILASAFGLVGTDCAVFAQDVFETLNNAEPESVLEEVFRSEEARAMEVRLGYAAITVAAVLSQFTTNNARD